MTTHAATAKAHANIALAKYWGKCDETLNLPAVPSLSITLDALLTETRVTLDPSLTQDQISLDGTARVGDDQDRATELLARLRLLAPEPLRTVFAQIETVNHFPTASGLASSASGFAALAGAAAKAYQIEATAEQLSAWARRSSASAARSVYGGFVELAAGLVGDDSLAARSVAPAEHWDVCVVIALASLKRKKTSSRDGMLETAKTSPYYPAWLGCAPLYFQDVRSGVLARDLEKVGTAMEASTFAMHASALAARPSVRYYAASTATLLDTVDQLRSAKIQCFSTMDAGPHVKVLCERKDAEQVREAMVASGAAVDVRVARPGGAIEVV
jgi:diphosphomevalonate decarboxylase